MSGGGKARPGMSLRSRVLWAFAAIAATVVAAAAVVTATIHDHLLDQLDNRLLAFEAAAPATGTGQRPGEPQPEPKPERPSDVLRGYVDTSGALWVIYAPNVGETDAVPLITVGQLPTQGRAFFSAPSSGDGAGFRVYARARENYIDITAAPLDEVYSTTRELVVIQAAAIAAVLAGLGLVAVWVIRLGVNPMRRMVAASTAIAEGDLGVRLEGAASGAESAELAASLDTMIENLTEAIAVRERSEARLRAFVADASHELRTPLTTVLGYAELYRRGALTRKAEVRDAWARTEAEAARMRRLVNDMLELSAYDAEPKLNLAELELMKLAAEVAADLRIGHPEAVITVEGESASVTGDADRLRQALLNVLVNALEHGGNHVTVTVAQGMTGVTLAVADDGPGMPPEIAARATERFVRADASRSRARGGAGLGLAITAAIVAAHGGNIAVSSAPRKGTVVTISLPARDARGDSNPA